MVTIKDIAKLAGVSHGTVSNVLNKRGNVSASKIRLVEETAQMLGYSLNSQAQSLRKGQSNKIMIFIPYSLRDKYYRLYDGLHLKLADAETEFEVELIYFDHLDEFQVRLERAIASFPSAIICIGFKADSPSFEQVDQQVKCYWVDCPKLAAMPNISVFSFDYAQVWMELRDYLCQQQVPRCLIVTEQENQQSKFVQLALTDDTIESRAFYLNQRHHSVALLNEMKQLTEQDALITTSDAMAQRLLELFAWLEMPVRPKIITLTAQQIVYEQQVIGCSLDYKRLGYLVAQHIVAETTVTHCLLPIGGLQAQQQALAQTHTATRLRMLTIKSPMTEALKLVAMKFKQETGIALDIEEKSYDELYEQLFHGRESVGDYDLIRIDSAWINSIAETLFQPFDAQFCQRLEQQLVPSIQWDLFRLRGQDYVLPLDLSVQLLLYRKDLFESPLVKRQYFEKNGQQLEVPTDFQAFDQVAYFFTRTLNPESETKYGHTLTGQKPVVLANDLLPRLHELVAQQGESVDLMTLEQQAFEAYRQHKERLQQVNQRWWGDNIRQFSAGETAMEIVFSNYASSIIQTPARLNKNQIGVARVPGNRPLIGGGAIGMTKQTQQQAAVYQLIEWLYRADVAQMITYFGGYLPTKSVVQSLELLELFPWLEAIEPLYQTGVRSKIGTHAINFEVELALGQRLLTYLAQKTKSE